MKGLLSAARRLVLLLLLWTVAAVQVCFGDGAAERDSVWQGSAQDCAIAPTQMNFGDVLVGESAMDTVAIVNTGPEPVSVSAINVNGPEADRFNVDTTAFSLAAAQRQLLDVTFTPDRIGAFAASLDLVCDDEATRIALSGSGSHLIVVVTPDEEPVVGRSLGLTADLPDGYQPETRELLYRQTGQSTYESIPFTLVDDRVRAEIPAEDVTLRGIEYYLRFARAGIVLTVPGTNPEDSPIPLRVHVEQMEAALDLTPLTYRMVSIPIELENADATMLLADDFGAYDSTRWRLLRWNPARDVYDEPPALSAGFTPGTAFWLNTRAGGRFNIGGGRSVISTVPYRITLAPGWNQVGTPFAFAVAWGNVTGSEQVEAPVSYDGVEYQYGQSVLEPWHGYFVYNPAAAPVELSFDPVEMGSEPEKTATDALSLAARGRYVVQLRAMLVNSNWRDTQNYIGLSTRAAEGRDELDVAEPPSVDGNVRLSVIEGNERLAASYKPHSQDGRKWEIEISVKAPGSSVLRQNRQVHIDLIEYGTRAAGHGLYVYDRSGRAVAVSNGAFTIEVAPGDVKRLRVIAGTGEYAASQKAISELPIRDRLLQNYPNPFHRSTTIIYNLDKPREVELAIYDVLGRRMQVLDLGEQEAGRHQAEWDGRDASGRPVPTGTYFYRLEAGAYRTSQQMLLLR